MSVRKEVEGSSSESARTMAVCWDWMKASIRRRMGDVGVMPDSRLERVSRSAIVGVSSFAMGVVTCRRALSQIYALG